MGRSEGCRRTGRRRLSWTGAPRGSAPRSRSSPPLGRARRGGAAAAAPGSARDDRVGRVRDRGRLHDVLGRVRAREVGRRGPGRRGARVTALPDLGDALRDRALAPVGLEQRAQAAVQRGIGHRRFGGARGGRHRGRRPRGRGREQRVEFGGGARAPGLVVEQAAVGGRRLRQVEGGGARRAALGRVDQRRGAARAQHMGGVEVAGGGLAPERGAQRVAVALGQGAGHRRRHLRVAAQVEDRLARRRVGDRIGAVGARRDGVGVGAEPELGARVLHHPEPGLLDELEQAGRRRGAGLGGRVQARFALRRGEQVIEADAARLRPVADGRDHLAARRIRRARRRGGGAGLARADGGIGEQEHDAVRGSRRSAPRNRTFRSAW